MKGIDVDRWKSDQRLRDEEFQRAAAMGARVQQTGVVPLFAVHIRFDEEDAGGGG